MRALFLALLIAFPPLASAQTTADLAWLKGCWRLADGAREITEVWSAPPFGALLGYAYTLRDGQVREWEQTRIQDIAGAPAFIAMPGGAAPTPFAMVEHGAQSVVFANPAHDFPQRVSYARQGNRLTATVSGGDGQAITFPYRRISCTNALRP